MDDITVITPETPGPSGATSESSTLPSARLTPIRTHTPLQIRTPPPQIQSLDTVDILIGIPLSS
jgi:hypothetical protein